MGYSIGLLDPVSKETIIIEDLHFMRGSTFALGGSHELSLDITYNYSSILHKVININGETGIRAIYGLTGLEVIPILEKAISELKDDYSDNYWETTEGNVKKALLHVLTMSKMRPDGIWNGD